MKRSLILIGIGFSILLSSSLAMARGNKTALSGTWNCVSHGHTQGDMKFILHLQQSKEVVDGSIESPLGATQISSGALRKSELELHFDMPQGSYTLMGHLEKGGKIVGAWSLDSDKGSWEGTKQDEPSH